MIILLMGPSGVGKTEWSKRLSEHLGCRRIEIDELIGRSETMSHLLGSIEGRDMAEKMGKYFGKPWENPIRYAASEEKYLQAERKTMRKICEEIRLGEISNAVIDLTGSAIYCPQELSELAGCGKTVYLQASPQHYATMLQNYIRSPKPVCWGRIMGYWLNGAREQELSQLYQRLLDDRHRLYQQFAKVVIPWEVHRNAESAAELMRCISPVLRQKTRAALAL